MHGSRPAQCRETGQPHERGRRRGPPLRLITEPDRQHSQQRPPQRKPQQHHTDERIFAGMNGAATNTTATSNPTTIDSATIDPSLL